MSQTPGMAAIKPARHSTIVSAAPTTSGGMKLNTNLRAGGDHIGNPAALAFRHIASIPIATASAPSALQVASHALAPTATPPPPGTAVNDPARSIVSRI